MHYIGDGIEHLNREKLFLTLPLPWLIISTGTCFNLPTSQVCLIVGDGRVPIKRQRLLLCYALT